MLKSFLDASTLYMQSQRVIGLRLTKMAWGGQGARDEAFQMVAEKIKASRDSARMLMAGASGTMVMTHYNSLVADNVRRLTAA